MAPPGSDAYVSSNYCSMLVVPEYFLSHPETESAVTFLTDERIFVVRIINFKLYFDKSVRSRKGSVKQLDSMAEF